MIAVDTNVVVRLLVRDDAKQAEAAAVLFARGPVGLSATVLLETAWVLRSGYRLAPAAVVDALRRVCALAHVVLEDEERCRNALDWAEGGLDFADALHLAGAQQAECFYTFDQTFARKSRGIGVASVRLPPPGERTNGE